jgi:protein-tyrosine phosphatase
LNGKPHLLVVGAADTGRAPLLAALLRHALGEGVVVTSAGILAHVGESADPNINFVLEQLDLAPVAHTARQLDKTVAHDADCIIAIDAGTAHVAAMRLERDVLSINAGSIAEDVQDPHRMPLGVWIAAMRAFQTQIEERLPLLSSRLGLSASVPHAAHAIEAPPDPPQFTATTDAKSSEANKAAHVSGTDSARAEHIAHIERLLATVEVLPEIVDWARLVRETTARLRALADLADGPDDYTLAAVLIVIGLLSQTERTPPAAQIATLREIVRQLASPVDADQLVSIARTVGA